MLEHISFRKIYINIVFPIYVISNLLSASTFAFAAEGEINGFASLLSYLRYVIYIVSIFYASTRQIKKNPLIYASLLTLLVIICLLINRNVQIICALFVFWALVDFKWEAVLKKQYKYSMIVVLLFLCFSQTGIIEDFVRLDGRTRHFLGFNWTTYAPIIWFFVTVSSACLNKGKYTIAKAAVFGIIATILYKLTETRLAYGLTLLVIAFFLIFSRVRKSRIIKAISRITVLSPFICALVSIMAHALYNPNSAIFIKLNSILSNRLYLGRMGLTNYGITLFGQQIEWRGFDKLTFTFENYNYVDCTYLHILLEYGLVFTIVFLILLTAGIAIAYKREKYNMCWALCFISILGMTEPWLLNFTFNPFMFCGVALFQKAKEEIIKQKLCIL